MPSPALRCIVQHDSPPDIVPAESGRVWMDRTSEHFAYRCTPLSIANASGWEIINPVSVSVTWNGHETIGDVSIRINEHGANHPFVSSAFGHGIVTFHPGYVFRTSPGWVIWARGSPNRIKDGIHPLDGIVETSWLPFSFTMNWKFTRPGTVTFEKGEPFCFITMFPSVALEEVQPIIEPSSADPDFESEVKLWTSERTRFSAALQARQPEAVEQKWQRFYLRGQSPSGKSKAGAAHRVRRKLRAPIKRTP